MFYESVNGNHLCELFNGFCDRFRCAHLAKKSLSRFCNNCKTTELVANALDGLTFIHQNTEKLIAHEDVADAEGIPHLEDHGFFALIGLRAEEKKGGQWAIVVENKKNGFVARAHRQPSDRAALALGERNPSLNATFLKRMDNVLALKPENHGLAECVQ